MSTAGVSGHELPPVLEVLSAGFEAYKQRIHAEVWRLHGRRFVDLWLARVLRDPGVGLPHRRILECLARAYDHDQEAFREVSFSMLVRQARVSRSRASGYLATLERKALIQRRSDGYRVHFRLAAPSRDGSSAPFSRGFVP